MELSDDLQQLREKCIEAIEELGEMHPTARSGPDPKGILWILHDPNKTKV